MANQTIYPYGQGGQLPSGYPIADDLNTDSAQQALSARQGIVLKSKLTDTQGQLLEVGQLNVELLKKVVFKDADAGDYITELEKALFDAPVSITAEYTQPGVIYEGQLLDDLRDGLVVTASYSDGTSARVTYYQLSGELSAGTSTIAVTYKGKTDAFTVNVTEATYLRNNTDETVYVASRVALRSTYTSTNKGRAATINGTTYWFTHKYTNTTSRASYYLFDLILTAGKIYQFILYYEGKPSGYNISVGLQYFDETFRVAGAANAGVTSADYGSNTTDSGWLTPQDDGRKLALTYEGAENTVGTRITLKPSQGGTEQIWPETLKITKIVIGEVLSE